MINMMEEKKCGRKIRDMNKSIFVANHPSNLATNTHIHIIQLMHVHILDQTYRNTKV